MDSFNIDYSTIDFEVLSKIGEALPIYIPLEINNKNLHEKF